MKIDPSTAPRNAADNGGSLVYLSKAGGLTQFGANIDRLMPGAFSSNRHWHDSEDELLYILEGTATAIDDDGTHILGPGDACCWRHGDPNAHHLENRTSQPVCYLMIGTRVAGDICTYPDFGSRQVNGTENWHVLDADDNILRHGQLPPHLLNLPARWGQPFDPANSFDRILPQVTRPWVEEPSPAHQILGEGPGPYRYQLISDLGGITQFGAFIEELPPGSASGQRHWHQSEDEMIYILSGDLMLVEDTETPLRAGDAACWPAGTAIGHRLDNRGSQPARYLVIGTRLQRDIIHYSDHDLITHKDGHARRYLRRDGTPYPDRSKA